MNQIKHYREAANLTQQELADRLGWPQPRIAELERRDSLAPIEYGRLADLADALETTVAELVGDLKAEQSP